MKIKRQALINILQSRLNDRAIERETKHQRALVEWQTAMDKYNRQTVDAWLNFASAIQSKIRDGKIVTRDDIPDEIHSGNFSSIKFFEKRKPLESAQTNEELQLHRLIEILNNSTDDEVSTYALEKMGFPLGRVVR